MKITESEGEGAKIFAITEAMILWDELARTGSASKPATIRELHQKGKLLFDHYKNCCPLCESFRNDGCKNCPWPGLGQTRCERFNDSLGWNDWLFEIIGACPRKTILRRCARQLFKSLCRMALDRKAK